MRKEKIDSFQEVYYLALSKVMSELRAKAGITCEDAALILGIRPNTFYRYESGYRSMPITIFKKLCVLYHVDMKETLDKVNEIATDILQGNIDG